MTPRGIDERFLRGSKVTVAARLYDRERFFEDPTRLPFLLPDEIVTRAMIQSACS